MPLTRDTPGLSHLPWRKLTQGSTSLYTAYWHGFLDPSADAPLSVGLVVALAAFLRVWNLGSVSFTYDAAAVSNLAADLVDKDLWPVLRHGLLRGYPKSTPLSSISWHWPTLFSHDPVDADRICRADERGVAV